MNNFQSVVANKSIVLDKSMWDSIKRRSSVDAISENEVDRQYKNYLLEESRIMANKWKTNLEASMKVEKEDCTKVDRLKFHEFTERFNGFEEQSENMENLGLGKAVSETVVACKRSLRQRKQDEYKTELRQFIESKRRQQMVLNEAEHERHRLERIKIDRVLKETLEREQIMLAERRAANRNFEMESRRLSGKTREHALQMEKQYPEHCSENRERDDKIEPLN